MTTQPPNHSTTPPRFSWQLLDAGPLLLDAGGMFGLIPRVVWQKIVQVDDRHRVRLNHNCILLHHPLGPVVIETGTGDKLDAKNRDIFGLTDRSIIPAIEETGTKLTDVKHVIVSHLHFDHAGGLTRRGRGTSVPLSGHQVELTFPNATIHAQEQEWNDAIANKSVMTRTYFRDHLDPIQDHLKLHNSPTPFARGEIPNRDEIPKANLEDRLTEVIPGVFVFNIPGHTWGQQAVMFKDDRGRTVVFTPDVMPTAWHVGSAYSLAYDVEPYMSMVSRHWFLREAAAREWLLVLDHDPNTPTVSVREDGKGWFTLTPQPLA